MGNLQIQFWEVSMSRKKDKVKQKSQILSISICFQGNKNSRTIQEKLVSYEQDFDKEVEKMDEEVEEHVDTITNPKKKK